MSSGFVAVVMGIELIAWSNFGVAHVDGIVMNVLVVCVYIYISDLPSMIGFVKSLNAIEQPCS